MKFFPLGKKFAIVLVVLILGSSLGVTIAIASGDTQGTEQGATEPQGNESGYVVKNGYTDLYEQSYARATTDEQREQLKAIFADPGIGLVGEWVRPVLIVLGDLPADTPRLTVHDAANLYGKVEDSDMASEFNKIAGAPDWVGGSGIYREIYYLNDERTEAIYLIFGDVHYWILNEDGTQTRLPIGDQELPPSPGPSIPPVGTPELPELDQTPAPVFDSFTRF